MATLNISELLKSMLGGISPLLWLLLGLSCVVSIARSLFGARIKGWLGERAVSNALRELDAKFYTSFHDLYLPRPDGKGSTQLDHVVVSVCGIFVIETKNYKGWIFGSEKGKQWTQTIYKKKSKFQNPLHQNRLHIRALEKFLGLNSNAFHSIVFFVGDCTFKTEMPPNVLRRGLGNHIRRYQTPILAPEVVTQCARALAELTELTNRKTAARSHSSALRARRLQEEQPITRPSQPPALPASADPPESLPRGTIPSCPRCAAPMVQRFAKTGARQGSSFWGCAHFPKCRGTRTA